MIHAGLLCAKWEELGCCFWCGIAYSSLHCWQCLLRCDFINPGDQQGDQQVSQQRHAKRRHAKQHSTDRKHGCLFQEERAFNLVRSVVIPGCAQRAFGSWLGPKWCRKSSTRHQKSPGLNIRGIYVLSIYISQNLRFCKCRNTTYCLASRVPLQVVDTKAEELLPLEPSLQIMLNRPAVGLDSISIAQAVQLALESAVGSE